MTLASILKGRSKTSNPRAKNNPEAFSIRRYSGAKNGNGTRAPKHNREELLGDCGSSRVSNFF